MLQSGKRGFSLTIIEFRRNLPHQGFKIIGVAEMRIRSSSMLNQCCQVLLHLADVGSGDEEPATVRGARKRFFIDERAQCLFDTVATVEDIHDKKRVGLVDQLLELDPAIALVQRFVHAMEDSGADAGGVILGGTHLSGDLVDPFESESAYLADDDIRVGFEQRQRVVAELLDKCCHLVVCEPERRQPCDHPVRPLRLEPFRSEILYGLGWQLRSLGDSSRLIGDYPVEIAPKAFGDKTGLYRTDALDVGMIGKVVGESVGVQVEVIFHGLDLELATVLGMCDPATV